MASPDLTSAEQAGGEAPQQVTYETLDEGRIARIWLNRPGAQNAQSRTLLVQLDEAFAALGLDPGVRAEDVPAASLAALYRSLRRVL